MNDWTYNFRRDNFPTVEKLYAVNGRPQAVDCVFWPSGHNYDVPKRERTYWWMGRWLCGEPPVETEKEPDEILTFPPATLMALATDPPVDALPENRVAEQISAVYEKVKHYRPARISGVAEWRSYRRQMVVKLRELLGEDAKLRRSASGPQRVARQEEEGLVIERFRSK